MSWLPVSRTLKELPFFSHPKLWGKGAETIGSLEVQFGYTDMEVGIGLIATVVKITVGLHLLDFHVNLCLSFWPTMPLCVSPALPNLGSQGLLIPPAPQLELTHGKEASFSFSSTSIYGPC